MPDLNEPSIILFYEPQPSRLVLSNGENDQVIIPNDLLPENLRNGSTMLDAVMCVRYLVQKIRELESENKHMKKIKPSIKDVMELYTHFVCANTFERERLAVQLALHMPELCLRIQNLETENQTLQEHIQKLEQQKSWLAKQCKNLSSNVEDCFVPYNIPARVWIVHAEETTKE